MKECFKCHKSKEIEEFYRHPRMADGHLNKCKECTKNDVARYAKENSEKVARYMRDREKTQERKDCKKRAQIQTRLKDPQRYKARVWTGNAIRDGRVKRLPCEKCGDTKTEAHHEDYTKPENIRWLCFRHHREAHGQTTHV